MVIIFHLSLVNGISFYWVDTFYPMSTAMSHVMPGYKVLHAWIVNTRLFTHFTKDAWQYFSTRY